MAFGKKPSSGEMRGKREKSDKAMRGKMPKQSDSKPAAKKAAPKKASPFEGGGSPFPFADGGTPMGGPAEMSMAAPPPRPMGMPAPRPKDPGMDKGDGGGMMRPAVMPYPGQRGGIGVNPAPRPMDPNGPAVSGVSQLPPGRPNGRPGMPMPMPPMPSDRGSGFGMNRGPMAPQRPMPQVPVPQAPMPQDPMAQAGGEVVGISTGMAKGGKVCMSSGGGVGDAIRKFVGMPTKKRGDQLERQEQEILNPDKAPEKKK